MSKGSKRRPAAVDERTLEERWAAINWNTDNDDPPSDESPEGADAGGWDRMPDVSG